MLSAILKKASGQHANEFLEEHLFIPLGIEQKWRAMNFDVVGRGHETGYGYLWWIQEPSANKDEETIVYSARGAFGQFIFIIPDHDMVIVVTADTKGEVFEHPVDFIYSHILPACL